MTEFVKFNAQRCRVNVKEFGFRSTLCTYRLNACARRTSREWWGEWDVIAAIQTEIRVLAVWDRGRYLPVSRRIPSNIESLRYDRRGNFCFIETRMSAEWGWSSQSPTSQAASFNHCTSSPRPAALWKCGTAAPHIWDIYSPLKLITQILIKKNSVVDAGDLLVLDRLIDFCKKLNKMIIIIKANILITSDKNNPYHMYKTLSDGDR